MRHNSISTLRVRKISGQVTPKKGNKSFKVIIQIITSLISVIAVALTYYTLKELQRQNDTTDSTLVEMQKQSSLTDSTYKQMQIQSGEMQNQSKLTQSTLKEMQLQRKKAYEPDLVIDKNIPFKLYAKVGYGMVHTYFYNNLVDTSHMNLIDTVCLGFYSDPNNENDCNIQLLNVGLGTAKDVTLYWSYDTTFFSNLYNNKLNHFKTIKHIYINKRKGVSMDNTPLNFINENKEITYFKYVLTVDSKNITYIKIPKSYLKLWSLIKLCATVGDSDHNTISILYKNPIPLLKLRITYFDINGNQYSKNYKILLKQGFNSGFEMWGMCNETIHIDNGIMEFNEVNQ